MKIATAQIKATVGDIEGNLQNHFEQIEVAIENAVDLIVFPEMSITGYCLEEGNGLAFVENDKRLDEFKKISKKSNIIIIAGAAIRIKKELFIGSFITKPTGEIAIYTKQFLHDSEEKYYSHSFDYNPIIELNGERINFAICADIDNPLHPQNAKINDCTIYIPSIFFSEKGINEGLEMLTNYAKEHSFKILMSNYCGEHFEIVSGGQSAFWNKDGKLMASLSSNKPGLIIAEKKNDHWATEIIESNRIQA